MTTNSQSGEKMSTLKTIAQEAVNALDSSSTQQQQQQQQHVTAATPTPIQTPSQLQQGTPQPADTRQVTSASIVGGGGGGSQSGGYPLDSTATNGPNSVVVVGGSTSGRESAKQLHQQQTSSTAASNQNQQQTAATNEAHIPPLLGVAPLGQLTLQKEHQIQVSFSLSFLNLNHIKKALN